MDWLNHLLLPNGHFLGIEWSVWKVIGWMGNAIFSTRFLVQWYATEKRQQVVVPPLFWWLSLAGPAPPVVLRPVSRARFGFHFRLRLHLDSLHSQSPHSSPPRTVPTPLPFLRAQVPGHGQFLRAMRGQIAERPAARGGREILIWCGAVPAARSRKSIII